MDNQWDRGHPCHWSLVVRSSQQKARGVVVPDYLIGESKSSTKLLPLYGFRWWPTTRSMTDYINGRIKPSPVQSLFRPLSSKSRLPEREREWGRTVEIISLFRPCVCLVKWTEYGKGGISQKMNGRRMFVPITTGRNAKKYVK